MEWTVSNFSEVGNQLILPFFEGVSKVPNNALSGLNRTQRSLVREAFSSGEFDAKSGRKMVIWTPGCRILLVGMGTKKKFTHKIFRNTGARVIASLSKKRGTMVKVRFTKGWNLEMMNNFAEGMMIRDYEFLEHQDLDDDHISEQWNVDFQANNRYQDDLKLKLKITNSIVGGVHLARDLGNEPANVLYPMEFARRIEEWSSTRKNIEVEALLLNYP